MPGSWEVMRAREGRVLIATITPPDYKVSFAWANAMRELEQPPGSDFLRVSGLPFGPARNQAVVTALNGGYGYLLFVDADTIPPKNMLTQLLASGRDFVGGLYFQRFPPFMPAVFMARQSVDDKGVSRVDKAPLPPYNPGEIIQVDFLPTGATLMSRRCLQAVMARFPKPYEWSVDIDRPGGGLSEDYDFCAPPGTIVLGEYPKAIEEFSVGDPLLTRLGFGAVTQVHERMYDGEMMTLRSFFNPLLQVTPNHPVWTKTQAGEVLWKEAGNLTKGDATFLPVRMPEYGLPAISVREWCDTGRAVLDEDSAWYFKRTHQKAPHLTDKLLLDKALLRLLGLFIAEGSLGHRDNQAVWTFNDEEFSLIGEVKETLRSLGIEAGERDTVGATQVDASCTILGRLLRRLCGKGARNKHLPPFWRRLNPAQLADLLGAIWAGDGSGYGYTTVSPRLAWEMREAFLSLGLLIAVNDGRARHGLGLKPSIGRYKAFQLGVPAISQAGFRAMFPELGIDYVRSTEHLGLAERDTNGFWLKLSLVERAPYSGKVHNLGAQPDQSYIAQGYTVHNCLKATSLGFRPWLMTGLVCRHEILMAIGARGPEVLGA